MPAASFHFGAPSRDVLDALRRAGTFTLATATTPDEARAVEEAGVDAVIAQGVEAGGHQGTHRDDPEVDGSYRTAVAGQPGAGGGGYPGRRGRRHHARQSHRP
ncbi:hypothetical protein SVIOM74S_06608 [Streptomyces violarus]